MQGLPDTVEPINMSEGQYAQMEAIATVIGDNKNGYHSAARELRHIARNTTLPTLRAPSWLEEPPVVQSPVVNAGDE